MIRRMSIPMIRMTLASSATAVLGGSADAFA